MKVAYLGPAGTFSEDALAGATRNQDGIEPLARGTIHDAIIAVEDGDAPRALVPFENSIEGSVRVTLDTLAFEAPRVAIAGEYDYAVRNSLISREERELSTITRVISHPQASAQCSRFIREELTGAEVHRAESTADAVRQVSESDEPWAAVGSPAAARHYDCVILREGIENTPDNVTRFVWIAPSGHDPEGDGAWKTSLVFSELGADHPGALVDGLSVFSDRGVNLVRIESRPLRQGLGRYMFFIDLEGAATDDAVGEAIEELSGKAESVRVLGSYPVIDTGTAP